MPWPALLVVKLLKFWSRRPNARQTAPPNAGFTLLEALVALAVIAASLTAIGALVAVNTRATLRLDERVTSAETARSLLASLSQRSVAGAATQTGELGGRRWEIRAALRPDLALSPAAPWTPQSVVIRVEGPGGRVIDVETIRLVRAPRQAP